MTTKNKIIFGSLAGFAFVLFLARKPITRKVKKVLSDQDKKSFIQSIAPAAKAIGTRIGVPPAFIVAQIALETRFGASTLWTRYNNPGGIKAVGSQRSIELDTMECKAGKCSKVKQKFAVYSTPAEGLEAYSKVLTNRYFKKYAGKTTDPLKYAELLQSGTPKYATALNYVPTIKTFLSEVKRLST